MKKTKLEIEQRLQEVKLYLILNPLPPVGSILTAEQARYLEELVQLMQELEGNSEILHLLN